MIGVFDNCRFIKTKPTSTNAPTPSYGVRIFVAYTTDIIKAISLIASAKRCPLKPGIRCCIQRVWASRNIIVFTFLGDRSITTPRFHSRLREIITKTSHSSMTFGYRVFNLTTISSSITCFKYFPTSGSSRLRILIAFISRFRMTF